MSRSKRTLLILNATKGARIVFHPTKGYRAMGIQLTVESSEVSSLLREGLIRPVSNLGGVYELTTDGVSALNQFNVAAFFKEVDFCCKCGKSETSQYLGLNNGRHWWLCQSCSALPK